MEKHMVLQEATVELVEKHRTGQTLEPLDRLLMLGLISEPEHHAGMAFRKLHHLRFGLRGLRSRDISDGGGGGGGGSHPRSEEEKTAQESTYHLACAALRKQKLLPLVTSVMVFHQPLIVLQVIDQRSPEQFPLRLGALLAHHRTARGEYIGLRKALRLLTQVL